MFDIMVPMDLGGITNPNGDLDVLEAALDDCLEVAVSVLSQHQVSERLARLQTLGAKFAAMRVAAVTAGTACSVGELSDQRNVANHVAATTNAAPASVRFDQRIADWLVDLPVLADALRSGTITMAHLDELRRADNPRVHQQVIESQAMFVEWFTTIAFRDLPVLLDQWLLGADPDGAAPNEQTPQTGATVTQLAGGMIRVEMLLDPTQGAAFRGDISDEVKRLRASELEAGGIARTTRRRTLEAILNVLGRGSARPDGTHARPRLHIVMSQRVYEDTLAWLEDPTSDFPTLDRSDIDSKCQLIDGTPIHPLYGIAASLTAKFRRTVFSARGRPIHDSYDTRSIPDWMRELALITSNGRCANPVCDAPFSWLVGDHITPYSHTQDTSVANTRAACDPDNCWRGNDTSRGLWPIPEPTSIEDRARAYEREQEETALARARVRSLIDQPPARQPEADRLRFDR